MQRKQFALSCAGALLLVLVSTSYAAETSTDVMVSPSPEAVNAPSDTQVAPTADQVSVANETPSEAMANPSSQERMAADSCANQSTADCERLKRRLDPQASAGKTGLSAAACSSHMDAKGNVIYDDPSCPSRMGGPVVTSPHAVYLIKDNPFFNLHIEKAVNHARAAEIAGNQGQAIDLLEHAQMSLMQAKEAQRAGNVPGLNEGIISLREALRLPETSSVREATAYVRDARKNLSQAGGIKYVEVQPQGVVATHREERR
jgi:hypothetical protein